MTFVTRAYNSFQICQEKGTVIKSSNTERLAEEIKFYENIPKEFLIWFPRILDSWSRDGIHSFEMELYSYSNLGEFLVNDSLAGKLSLQDWENIADLFSCILTKFASHRKQDAILKDEIKSMYVDKTLREYRNLIDNFPYFNELSKEKTLNINGKACLSFDEIWKNNENLLTKILFTDDLESPCFTHGDMCFSNILFNKHQTNNNLCTIKFIDPRGKFGNLVGTGDQTYDLAKLMHSVHGGYEYFINDKFTVVEHAKNSFLKSYSNNNKEKIFEIFNRKLFAKRNVEKIKLIEGLIYIGMVARHSDSFQRQLAMYLTGIEILNDVLENNG